MFIGKRRGGRCRVSEALTTVEERVEAIGSLVWNMTLVTEVWSLYTCQMKANKVKYYEKNRCAKHRRFVMSKCFESSSRRRALRRKQYHCTGMCIVVSVVYVM